MAKIVYLVLAHNCPAHLRKLVAALSCSCSSFLVHIDKKVDIEAYHEAVGTAVEFTRERVEVHWGDFSQVEATCILIREALEDTRKFDRFVLLSGTDYPVRPKSYIWQFFDSNRKAEFIDLVQMPSVSDSKPLSRLTDYQPPPVATASTKLVRKIAMRMGIKPRQRDYKKIFGGLTPYAGSTWWALTRHACEYIDIFTKENSALVDFFRNTVCPDEMFFHTILGNSIFRSKIQSQVTYADWTAGGPSPAYITMAHVEAFRSSHASKMDAPFSDHTVLFARKFSDGLEHIVAAIDRQLLGEVDELGRISPMLS
jgi:hypothetical protein